MYLLDTHVVSELRKVALGRADEAVVRWENRVSAEELFLSAITILELEIGVLSLERRNPSQSVPLRVWFDQTLLPAFSSRILPVDSEVAKRCAALQDPNRRPERDAFIAATALVHGMTVVTRDTSDFASTGVRVLNPWDG